MIAMWPTSLARLRAKEGGSQEWSGEIDQVGRRVSVSKDRSFVGCFRLYVVGSVKSIELKPGKLKGDVV